MHVVHGSRLRGPQTVRAEVCVIGSGSGGAVIARELAEEGFDVIVLEEGPYHPLEEYSRWRPMETFRRMARAGGSTIAVGAKGSPTVNVLAGSCVGGGSVLTGGVCFRVPDAVHDEWVELLGTDSLSTRAMQPLYHRVEEMVHVEEVPVDMRPASTVRFAEGAEKLGWPLKPLRRNTKGCCGCSRCNFGCPHGAKMSVDLTYLPRACERGARVYADHRVDRLRVEGGRITAIEGRLVTDPDRRSGDRFVVHADHVIVAAGTMHTPVLLGRSRIGRRSRQMGRNLTLHPAFRAMATFDEPVEVWKGALQSAYSDAFEHEKLMFVSASAPMNMLAAGLPGVGPEWMDRTRAIPHLATFGFMLHDDPSGRVRRTLGREPFVSYAMSESDRTATRRGLELISEAFFAGGAREVLLPIFGASPIRSMDELGPVLDDLDFRRIECFSFHPLGTCRMGTDASHSVCDHTGRVWGLDNLWLADGSVVPTSVGVNTQIPIMTMATRIAFAFAEAARA